MKTGLSGFFISQVLGEKWQGGAVPADVCGAAIDTRKIQAGEIFVAIKTENRDGHDFLNIARERGAAGAIVSRFVPEIELPQLVVSDPVVALQKLAKAHREENCRGAVLVVGVTGSVGKTSTKDLLAHIFSKAGSTLATEGNLNNTLGVPLTLLKIDSRTCKFAVVEAGMSISGEMKILAEMISPDIAVITNVRPAHLEGLGSMENIAREKSALAVAVSARGKVFFHKELLCYSAFSELLSPPAFPVENAVVDENDEGFEIKFEGQSSAPFFVKNVSRGLAENAVLAMLATREFVPEKDIRAALAGWKPSAKRGEIRARVHGKIFVDCYNASPSSMLDSALSFAKRFPANAGTPRLFVLGGMGELGSDSKKLHFGVGEKLPLSAETDTLALFGGHAAEIGAGAIVHGFPRERVFIYSKIEDLKKTIVDFCGNVMVKGSRAFALERAVPED